MSKANKKLKPPPKIVNDPVPEPLARIIKSLEGPEAPEISDTLSKARAALKGAKKVATRKHVCRICSKADCPHYERHYIDGAREAFDLPMAPDMNESKT